MHKQPFTTVLLSAATYSLLLRLWVSSDPVAADLRPKIKAISAAHSAITTGIALWILRFGTWEIRSETTEPSPRSPPNVLDDSKNIIIAGKSYLANVLTAWETGYLVYDTGALLVDASYKTKVKAKRSNLFALAQQSPLFLGHHLALVSAFIILQHYISNGREKGLWVIIAMLLMNISNPILHLRWWMKKRYAREDNRLNVVLAFVFAVCRFGNLFWILKKYGRYHGLNPLEAYKTLKWHCRSGTALLLSLNALWWVSLVRKIGQKLKGNGVRQGKV